MTEIAIIVLHYETISETIECIESIIRLKKENISLHTIIVDNGSKKNPAVFDEKYNFDNIKVVSSEDNLGFAQGNNFGIKYALKEYRPDFIICINNDVEIDQEDFLYRVIESYNNNKFDILGPTIITPKESINQNPIYSVLNTVNDVEKRLLKYRVNYFLSFLNLDLIARWVFKKISRKSASEGVRNDYQLNGSALIFSKKYFEAFMGFYPETFMYCEEDFLKHICVKYDLKMIYDSNLSIIHKEEKTSSEIFKKNRRKRQFIYKYTIDSYKKLIKFMKEE